MATRLTKLRVKEISGVDAPANNLPGWLVMKSKDDLAQVEAFEKAIGMLHDELASDHADVYFSDAPPEVLKARADLIGYISQDVEDDGETVTEKSVGERFKSLFKAGAYDEPGPDDDQIPTGTLDEGAEATSAAPRVDQIPGDPEGGEAVGAGQDKQTGLDLSEGKEGKTPDKYGRETDDKTGELTEPDPADEPAEDDEPDAEAGKEEEGKTPVEPEEPETPEEETPEEEPSTEVEFASDEAEAAAEDLPDSVELKPGEGSGANGKYNSKDIRKLAEAAKAEEDNVEKMAKSVAGVIEAEMSPVKDAIFALADRLENVEKSAATRQGITLDDVDPTLPDEAGEVGIAKSLRVALREGKVTLT